MYEVIGYLAAFFTTIAFIPQVIKIYKDKSARSISSNTFYIFSLGVGMWLVYGIVLDSLPMILANSITMTLSIIILVLKFVYRSND